MSLSTPTLATIARAANVSTNTVSLALRNDPRVRPATRDRIQALAQELGYRPNPLISDLMAQMRRGGPEVYRGNLALLNAHPDFQSLNHHPSLPAFLKGCHQQALARGYQLDELWLHANGQNPRALNRILTARNIRGIVLVGVRSPSEGLITYNPTWEKHAVVVTGVRTHLPALNYCSTDQYLLVRDALDQAVALGYRRPALAFTPHSDALVDHRYHAALLGYTYQHPTLATIPSFFECAVTETSKRAFQAWYRSHQPDLILTFYRETKTWLQELGVSIPDQVGIIILDRLKGSETWSHMDQHDERIGADAINLLVSMLQLNESGIPSTPRATLRRATWVPGTTTRCAAQA